MLDEQKLRQRIWLAYAIVGISFILMAVTLSGGA